MKKRILAIAVIVICLAVVGYGATLAFFTDEAVAHNVITTGGVGVEIHETTDKVDSEGNPIPFENVSGVMPGMSVSKIVQGKNTGASPAWIRIKVDVGIYAPSTSILPNTHGDPLPLTVLDKQGNPVDVIRLDFDQTKWIRGENGYYYYNDPVAVNELTAPLFKTVTFAGAMGNEYQNCKVEINIVAEAVQTANNPAPGDDVTAIQGWPANPNS